MKNTYQARTIRYLSKLFLIHYNRTHGIIWQLLFIKQTYSVDATKYYFTNRVWYLLPCHIVSCPTLSKFKSSLQKHDFVVVFFSVCVMYYCGTVSDRLVFYAVNKLNWKYCHRWQCNDACDFVCQLIQGHNELRYYKNGFIKLAALPTPFFGLSPPTSAERYQVYKTISNQTQRLFIPLPVKAQMLMTNGET